MTHPLSPPCVDHLLIQMRLPRRCGTVARCDDMAQRREYRLDEEEVEVEYVRK